MGAAFIALAMKFAILTNKPSSFAYVEACLAAQNVTCVRFDDALALLRARRTEVFELLMIDAQIFSTAGRVVLSWRECNSDMRWPTLVYGHFAEREEVRNIFDTGIEDFIADYFSAEELCARVRRILRGAERKTKDADSAVRIVVGPYHLCRVTRTVLLHDAPIRLTAREFATAWLLFSFSGAFLSRQKIASTVWGTEVSVAERSIEQHIYKLRKKLGFGEATGVELRTVYAHGYQLAVHEAGEKATKIEPALPPAV